MTAAKVYFTPMRTEGKKSLVGRSGTAAPARRA